MDAREKYEQRAKNRKSIDFSQANQDDPLQRSIVEQKKTERPNTTHRRTYTTLNSTNNFDGRKTINDLIMTTETRASNPNLEYKLNNGANPILFVNNRIEFGNSAVKVNSKIVIKKDEPYRGESETLTRSQTTIQPSTSKRDHPDIDPLLNRLVVEKISFNNSSLKYNPSQPQDINKSIDSVINQPIETSEHSAKPKSERKSFMVNEKVIFQDGEIKKDITIRNNDESSPEKSIKFQYTKVITENNKQEHMSPTSSISTAPTPTKNDMSSSESTPVKANIAPIVTENKFSGKLNLESETLDEVEIEKLKVLNKIKQDYQQILKLDLRSLGIIIAPSLESCMNWNGIIFVTNSSNKRIKYRFEIKLGAAKPKVVFTSKPNHPMINSATGEMDLSGFKENKNTSELLLFIKESIYSKNQILMDESLSKTSADLERIKGVNKPTEDENIYIQKIETNSKFNNQLAEYIVSLGKQISGASRVEKILEFAKKHRN